MRVIGTPDSALVAADLLGSGHRLVGLSADRLGRHGIVRRQGLILVSAVITIMASACSTTTNSVATGGTTWSAPVRVESNGSSSLYGVSCPTAVSCIAVDENGSALFWHDRMWSSSEPVGAGGTLTSISCPSTSFCVTVSAGGTAVKYDGHSWSSAAPVGPAATYKVSCPTITFCAAVGASGTSGAPNTVATFNGDTWSSQLASGAGGLKDRFLDVSCATPEFCVAVNLDGKTLVWDSQAWSNVPGGGPQGMISVSCPSTTVCLAITNSGAYAVFDGRSWSASADIPNFATAFAYSVSCASTVRCTALGLGGMAVSWQQGRWSAPVRVFPGTFSATVALSCVAPDICTAINSKGESARN